MTPVRLGGLPESLHVWFLACRLPEEEFAVKKKANPAIPRLVLPPGYSISRVALSRFGTWRVARVARVTHLEVSCPKIAFCSQPRWPHLVKTHRGSAWCIFGGADEPLLGPALPPCPYKPHREALTPNTPSFRCARVCGISALGSQPHSEELIDPKSSPSTVSTSREMGTAAGGFTNTAPIWGMRPAESGSAIPPRAQGSSHLGEEEERGGGSRLLDMRLLQPQTRGRDPAFCPPPCCRSLALMLGTSDPGDRNSLSKHFRKPENLAQLPFLPCRIS